MSTYFRNLSVTAPIGSAIIQGRDKGSPRIRERFD